MMLQQRFDSLLGSSWDECRLSARWPL